MKEFKFEYFEDVFTIKIGEILTSNIKYEYDIQEVELTLNGYSLLYTNYGVDVFIKYFNNTYSCDNSFHSFENQSFDVMLTNTELYYRTPIDGTFNSNYIGGEYFNDFIFWLKSSLDKNYGRKMKINKIVNEINN